MASNPDLVEYWPFADVLIAPKGTPFPADIATDFSPAWKRVGCLDGDAGFTDARNWTKSKRSAWGGVLMRMIRKDFDFSKKFTAFEGGNKVVDDLVWPNKRPSTGGVRGDVLGIPHPERVLVAFELREGTKRKRMISYYQAEIDMVGDGKDSESDVTPYEFEVQFFPDGNGDLVLRQGGPDDVTLTGLTVTPASKSLAVGAIAKIKATATWSDASTRDVSADAVWVSADEAKATADRGYVTGVAVGTGVAVTAMFGTSTATCTVAVTA